MVCKSNSTKKVLLLKTLLVFFVYFLYSYIVSYMFDVDIIIKLLADIIFMFGVVFAYKNNLKADVENIHKNYNLKKIIKIVIIWVLIILCFNIFMGALSDFIAPSMGKTLDANSDSIRDFASVSLIYTIFKTMIFSIVAEELLFRESIYDVIKNKWLFIFISAFVYTLMNFIFTDFNTSYLWIRILSYFLPAMLFSYSYYKNDKNIVIFMLIKFTYQLIPLALMLVSI